MILTEQLPQPQACSRMLRAMFEARKAIFVDLLKWDLPVLSGRYEVDQFDDCHAHYLIVADSAGHHLASARLLTTTRPHILGSLFPQLCAGPVPAGDGIAEITRFCLSRSGTAMDRRYHRNRLISAIVRHALDHDIRQYTGVAELGWLQQILAFGWDCRPLGPPVTVDGSVLGALSIEITARTPQLLRENGIWIDEAVDTPVLEAA